jgi:tetratricopeptide (TPR) repeat protein
MTGKIFINYRRGDEPGFTQALFARLEQAFPSDQLFMDVDNIPPGEDFVRMLDTQVAQCDALLAVIGKGWLNATDENGNRRLDDPNDFVRIEIESALKQGKRVIPILVNDARMPRPDDLPESVRPLTRRNAVRLTHERFRADAQGLVKALQRNLEEAEALRAQADRERKQEEEAARLRSLEQLQAEARRRTDEDARRKQADVEARGRTETDTLGAKPEVTRYESFPHVSTAKPEWIRRWRPTRQGLLLGTALVIVLAVISALVLSSREPGRPSPSEFAGKTSVLVGRSEAPGEPTCAQPDTCTRLIESGKVGGKALARLYYSRGLGYSKTESVKAIKDFEQVLRLDPTLIEASKELDKLADTGAWTYWTCGSFSDPDRNIAACTNAMGLGDGLDELIHLETRGKAYLAKGEYGRAVADLEAAKRKFPKNFGGQADLDRARTAVSRAKQ